MKITFYGARSDIPTPGPETQHYGGNTHCLMLTSSRGQKLIINAGSGIRFASPEFQNYNETIHILLSQHHWDHIQGLPFFEPINSEKQTIMIYPADLIESHDTAILEQINKSYTVRKFHQLPAQITIKKMRFSEPEPVIIGDFQIQSLRSNHPSGGSAYKIICEEKTIVIANNNELYAPDEHCFNDFDAWRLFCEGADLLIHDAKFMNADMVNKMGQGHSCVNDALELANAAEVKMLCMSCIDPSSSDELLDYLTTKLYSDRHPFSFFFAKEGRSMFL
jgi:ribonuclease BN (tRNA processing enzyme)